MEIIVMILAGVGVISIFISIFRFFSHDHTIDSTFVDNLKRESVALHNRLNELRVECNDLRYQLERNRISQTTQSSAATGVLESVAGYLDMVTMTLKNDIIVHESTEAEFVKAVTMIEDIARACNSHKRRS